MDQNTVIKVDNVTKMYKLYDNPKDRLKEALIPTKKKRYKEHYALNGVSFDVKKGDTVLLPKYGGTEVKVGDKKLQLVREEDLLGVIEK